MEMDQKDDGLNCLSSQSAPSVTCCVIFRTLFNLSELQGPPEKTASRPPHSTQQGLSANNWEGALSV